MTLTHGFRELLREANATVHAIDAAGLIGLIQRGSVVCIDLRENDERLQHGTIPGAVHAPRGELEFYADPESPYHMPVFASDRSLVLFCAGGWRSALAAQRLQYMGVPHVSHLAGGFEAWSHAGGDVEPVNA